MVGMSSWGFCNEQLGILQLVLIESLCCMVTCTNTFTVPPDFLQLFQHLFNSWMLPAAKMLQHNPDLNFVDPHTGLS